MSKESNRELAPLALRQTRIIDADKVRYRVYRNKNDYVAVIAESALMAMKVADIKDPYRIVRDLPTHETAIGADRLVREENGAAKRVTIPTTPQFVEKMPPKVELKKNEDTPQTRFKPMQLGDFWQIKKETALRTQAAASPAILEEIPVSPTSEAMPETGAPVANETLANAPLQSVPKDVTLSPEDVEKLLNG